MQTIVNDLSPSKQRFLSTGTKLSRILEQSASGLSLTEETKSENEDKQDFEYFDYSPELINPASPSLDQDDNISSPE